jgi:hypothetical protein
VNVVDDRQLLEASHELKNALISRYAADQRYQDAIKRCVDLGMSNVKMGELLGFTEASIRMYRKRHNL